MSDRSTLMEMEKELGITVDEIMRNSVEELKGPHDPPIKLITTYMQQYKAKIDVGRKPKRSEVDEGIMGAKMLPPKKTFRRF